MSKNRKELPASYDPLKTYSLFDAVALLPELSTSKFVGSVDIDIVLNLSDKQKKETLRGSISFPHRFGAEVKIIVFGDEKAAKEAKAAGANDAGLEELIQKVEQNKVEYDIVIATPEVMAQIAKLGKILGPKGLMPNPTNGTIAKDVTASVSSYLAGKQNFKMSDQGVIRGRVAKLDMTAEQIAENIKSYVQTILSEARKFGQQPIKKIVLSPTMGKALKVDVESVLA